MQNRIEKLFTRKHSNILNIYFTAGYPKLENTSTIISQLAASGADMIEIGIPFSDPVADGPTIQHSSQLALQNGMNLKLLFEQLADIRNTVDIPLILMGYLNPVMQYGIEAFCQKANEVGIDGLILPDLPMREYELKYKALFEANGLSPIFLVTPQTSEERIRKIDSLSNAFIYIVSMDSTTGRTGRLSEKQITYFERIRSMQLRNPILIGFGISDKQSFSTASQYASGAIIGSAFIKALGNGNDIQQSIDNFIHKITGNSILQ